MNKGVLTAVGLSLLAGETLACSAVIVGKRASASGHVVVAHNDDGALRLKMRYAFVPAQPGKLGYFWHECKDPEGGITPGDTMLNECGVIVNSNNGGWMETWCGRKGTLPDEGVYSTLADGGVGYELRRTVAERAHTAHEGVAVATNLLATCGYTQPSRNFIIADKDEAWVLTVVRGRRYVARRCPDDAVVAYPNCMTVAKIRPDDIVSANIEPRRADFDFTAAYQGPRTWRSPYNLYRTRSLYRIVCGREPDCGGDYPFSMRPEKPVDAEMIKAALRCHYEGTPDVLTPPHPTKADEVAEKYKAPICREGTRESYVYAFADDVKDIVLDLAVGRPCETPYKTFRPHGGVLPAGALTGEAALRRMADRATPLATRPCAAGDGHEAVRVSDYGYDAEDSTRFLQMALDSGADRVVIDSRRWVTLPLTVRSCQDIVFEEGAVVEAKKGAFLGKDDAVFNLLCVSNVTLCGKGEVRMHHDDYLKPPYKKAEWRHAINILGCDDIRVSGLRLVDGGGDGVYVGALGKARMRRWGTAVWRPWSSNVRLADLHVDTHVRQGLSVTSCKGFSADRCVFKNTRGLPPQAGVDLEPNGPENPIVGMAFRDCTFENNKGAGFEFALSHLDPKTSEKYDCLFERCRFVKDNLVVHNTRSDHTQVGGRIVLRDCVFVDPEAMPLAVGMMPDRPFSCALENCRIVDQGVETKIDEDWLIKNAPLLAAGDCVPSVRTKVDYAALEIVDPEPGVSRNLQRFTFRNHVRFAVYADQARQVKFKGGYASFGRFKPKKTPVLGPLVIEDASGAKIAEVPMPIYEKKNPPQFAFDAPAKGFYFIKAEMNRKGFVLAEADAPVAVDLTGDWQDLVGSKGTLAFFVPPEAPRFGVFVSGDGGECVAAAVKDPSGATVWSNGCVSAWAGHVADAGSAFGLWTLTLSKPEKGGFEDERIDLVGIPGFFFLDPARYWKVQGFSDDDANMFPFVISYDSPANAVNMRHLLDAFRGCDEEGLGDGFPRFAQCSGIREKRPCEPPLDADRTGLEQRIPVRERRVGNRRRAHGPWRGLGTWSVYGRRRHGNPYAAVCGRACQVLGVGQAREPPGGAGCQGLRIRFANCRRAPVQDGLV